MAWNPKGQEPDMSKDARLAIIEAAMRCAIENGNDPSVLAFLTNSHAATSARPE